MDELTSIVSGSCRRLSQGGHHFPTSLPETSASSYGWIVCPESQIGKWGKPKITDSIVRYAELYYEQNGVNPFQIRKT